MEIKGKTLVYGAIILIILLLLIVSFKGTNQRSDGINEKNEYSSIPEKCRPPSGEGISSWKEHLGHHAETRECLQYFN